MTSRATSGVEPRVFPPTRWSLVLAAAQPGSPAAEEALDTLCRAYWFPLYAFVRRSGRAPEDAQDLTQEFFRRLLEKQWLRAADPAKGRLRTFLLTALQHFLAKEWRFAAAQRRGGGAVPVPLDTSVAESRYAAQGAALPAEETFDRQWALALLEKAFQRLRGEFAQLGKASDFQVLKPCLMAARGAVDYAEVADRLHTNEGAARVAVHRLRKRFREVYREEISHTLAEGANLDEELRHLAAALARPG